MGENDFIRDRKLNLVNTIGNILYLASHRNGNGYAITSQNYFFDYGKASGSYCEPANRSSFCEAREKVSHEAFGYLLDELNEEAASAFKKQKWNGHDVRAVDGTFITLPCSKAILEEFPRRESMQNKTHYPYALLVTATNVFTGIPKAARFVEHRGSDRDQLLSILDELNPGDISLLDRGYDGVRIWKRFDELKQHYVARIRVGGYPSQGLKGFLSSNRIESIIETKGKYNGQEINIKMRLIRAGVDRKGLPIVIGTNLFDQKKYKAKAIWELYKKRWKIETAYGRVKQLFCLEKFHSRKVNGILQEILANLLVLGLTAYLSLHAINKAQLDSAVMEPNFKNAAEVLRRYLIFCFMNKLSERKSRQIAIEMLHQIGQVLCKKQPGRKNPRVSKQPTTRWNKQLGKNTPKNKYDKMIAKEA